MQVVELGGNILEKPDDEEHAYRMLSSLSGGTHNVHTGVVMVLPTTPGGRMGCGRGGVLVGWGKGEGKGGVRVQVQVQVRVRVACCSLALCP